MLAKIQGAYKALVGALGMIVTILTFVDKIPFLPHDLTTTGGIIAGAITVFLTWVVPNKTPPPAATA